MVSVHQLSVDANTIRTKGATMNERVTIYLDCAPKESLEEFGKRFYRCNINPTNLARCVWNVFKKGYIYPQGIYGDSILA